MAEGAITKLANGANAKFSEFFFAEDGIANLAEAAFVHQSERAAAE